MAVASPPPFVGRAPVMAALRAAVAGGAARLVTGPWGIGRTRVLEELAGGGGARAPRMLPATRSGLSIPLGIFLPLVTRPAGILETAADLRLRLVADDAPLLVDDVHLVDDESAALLLDLHLAGVAIVMTAVEGAALPDAVDRMTGVAGRVPLDPLEGRDLEAVLRAGFGAPPDPGLVAAVFRRSGGVPLMVLDTVQVLRASASVGIEAGTAYLTAAAAPAGPSLLAPTLARLPADVLEVARWVALAGEVAEPVIRSIAAPGALGRAEAAGLVVVDADGGVDVVAPRLPAIGETIARSTPRGMKLALLDRLVTATTSGFAGETSPLAQARRVGWRLQVGAPVDDAELLGSVALVRLRAPSIAGELLDAALRRRLPPAARLQLAELLVHQQRVDDAEGVLSSLDGAQLSDDLARRRDLVHAFVLGFPGNEPARALEILDRAGSGDREVQAHAAGARMQLGEIGLAHQLSARVVTDPGAPLPARTDGLLTLSMTHLFVGDGDAFEECRRLRRGLLHDDLAPPEAGRLFRLIDGVFLLEHREALDATQSLARAAHDAAVARGDDGLRAQHAHLLARVALERGAPAHALPLAVSAVAADGLWSRAFCAWTSATLVETLVLAGRVDDGAAQLERASRRTRSPLYDIDIARARAVVRAAQGEQDDAAGVLAEAAAAAVAKGQITRGRYALEQAVRYGSDAAARHLVRLRHGGPATSRAARLARAWLERDPVALETSAEELEARGMLWRAAEVAAAAAVLRPGIASAVVPRIQRRMHGIHSPVLPAAGWGDLTAREREIAAFAAAGRSDLEIAELIRASGRGVSIRTVQTHLTRVYRKLGASGRGDLVEPDAVAPPT